MKKKSFVKKFWTDQEIVLGGNFPIESLMGYISFVQKYGERYIPKGYNCCSRLGGGGDPCKVVDRWQQGKNDKFIGFNLGPYFSRVIPTSVQETRLSVSCGTQLTASAKPLEYHISIALRGLREGNWN